MKFPCQMFDINFFCKVKGNHMLGFTFKNEHYVVVEYDGDNDMLEELCEFSKELKELRNTCDFFCMIPIKTLAGKRLWNLIDKINDERISEGEISFPFRYETLINAIEYSINDQNRPRVLIEKTIESLNRILEHAE